MWHSLVIAVFLVGLAVLLRRWRHAPSLSLYTIILALWGRFFLFYFPGLIFPPVVAGQSLIALYSAAVVAVGTLHLRLRQFLHPPLFPFYLLFIIIILSAMLNRAYVPLILELMRWTFFVIVLLLTMENIKQHGRPAILTLFACVLALPLVLQFMSVGLGVRSLDAQGAVIYIGQYGSLPAFWRLLFTLACVLILIRPRNDGLMLLFCASVLIGLYWTNNRTSIGGTLPIFLMFMYSYVSRILDISAKAILTFGGAALLMFAIPLAYTNLPEKYAAVQELVTYVDKVVEDPRLLTDQERLAGTGRIGIWTTYLFEWRHADWPHKLLGFGPDAFTAKFPHNDHLGMLYQFGLLGFCFFTLILVWQAVAIARVRDAALRERLIGCFAGFLVITQTTDAVWNLESLIALAIICAVTWSANEASETRAPAPRRIGQRWATGAVGSRSGSG